MTPHICKLNKPDLEQSFKKHLPNISLKNRQDFKDSSKNSRFKIINLSRSINENEHNNSEEQKTVTTVLDIETERNKDDDKDSTDFVYDVYYTNSDNFGDFIDDQGDCIR